MKKAALKDQLTILITVYNRQFNIDRQLQFWENSGFKVIFIDSSQSAFPFTENKDQRIEYRHFKEGTFYGIIYSVLEQISTPYVIQINDDDFVLKSSLLSGIKFLEEHNEYLSYQGSFMKFNEKGQQTHPFYCCRGINNFHSFDNGQNSVPRRLDLMQRSFVSPNHAIFRLECLQSAYDLVRDQPKIQSIKYFDWIIGFVCALSGKFYLSKQLFHLRSEERLITDMGNSEYPDYLQRNKRLRDLRNDELALKILASFLKEKRPELKSSMDETKGLIKENLSLYIKMFHSGGFFYRLKWKLSCLPFLLFNQYQINFRFSNEIKAVMKLIKKAE